ncbi:uncharacterized protein TrAFT101_009859 [Trichoderma asperellum]|uniref:uncharacterized protein n=1 Tax=Trichoderma asperellum TaxID=101201 RepID=UPI00332FBD2F|nr:hypothetical protein TrAFT101_009859 [Trichoderma asperellum]
MRTAVLKGPISAHDYCCSFYTLLDFGTSLETVFCSGRTCQNGRCGMREQKRGGANKYALRCGKRKCPWVWNPDIDGDEWRAFSIGKPAFLQKLAFDYLSFRLDRREIGCFWHGINGNAVREAHRKDQSK